MARVAKGAPTANVTLEKVTNNKCVLTWPKPVSHDTCARLAKIALGANWKDYVSKPAGVPGCAEWAGTANAAEDEPAVAEGH
eukprot:9005643-Pyramimonas_sp.AAC.1